MARAGIVRRAVRAFSRVAIKPVNRFAKAVVKVAPAVGALGLYGLHKFYQYRRKAINAGIHGVLNTVRGEWKHARKSYLDPRKWWSAYKHHHQPGVWDRSRNYKPYPKSPVVGQGGRRWRRWTVTN